MAFVAAVLSGLIFVLGSLRTVFFGESFAGYIQDLFPAIGDPLAQALETLMLVANFAGWIILFAAVLIAIGRLHIAKLILFIVIGAGLFSFFIPVIGALTSPGITGDELLTVLLNGDATMYLVAVLFGIIAKLNCDKAT